MDAEAERDDHADAHDTIQQNTPHHGLGQLNRGIFQLFTHVSSSIRSDEAPNRSSQAYEASYSGGWPSTAVVKGAEGVRSRCMVAHHPKSDEECKKGEYMDEQDDAFGERQLVSGEDVEADDDEQHSENDEGDLPRLGEASVWIADKYHLLYDAGELKCTCWDACDPTDSR